MGILTYRWRLTSPIRRMEVNREKEMPGLIATARKVRAAKPLKGVASWEPAHDAPDGVSSRPSWTSARTCAVFLQHLLHRPAAATSQH
jgi:hypothetical protein